MLNFMWRASWIWTWVMKRQVLIGVYGMHILIRGGSDD